MIKNLPRFIKYTKDKQNHQKWVENNWHKVFLLKQNWITPFQPLPFPPLSWWWGRKTGSHIGNLFPAAPPVPTSTAAFSFHSGSKVTSWKLRPPPGPSSVTASSPHVHFAFQDFLHRAPTIRIPKAARGESLDVSLKKGGCRRPPMTGGVWLTPVLQDLNSKCCLLKGRRERGKYHPPPHTHMQLTNCTPPKPAIPPQTLHSKWTCLLLHSNSFQE